MHWDFIDKRIVGVDFYLDTSRYSSNDLSILFDDNTRISFLSTTDCCASMGLRTSRKEFAEIVGKQLVRLEQTTTYQSDEWGAQSSYHYVFHFADGTELDFDFDGDHGNGGYYCSMVEVVIHRNNESSDTEEKED